ncbi:hypothetical protein GQ457_01G011240 [Hibiscus cannabinus]
MFQTQSGCGTIDIVARDHHGLVVAGCAPAIPRAHSVEAVESHAILCGYALCHGSSLAAGSDRRRCGQHYEYASSFDIS